MSPEVDHAAALVVALFQMLVDHQLLKGDEEQLFRELLQRAADLRTEAATEAKTRERIRRLIEIPEDRPKQ
jgi:hypothetical protein